MAWTRTEPQGVVYGEVVETEANTNKGGQYKCSFRFGRIDGTRTVVIESYTFTRAYSYEFKGTYENGPTISTDGTNYVDGEITSRYSGGHDWYKHDNPPDGGPQYWVAENVPRGQVFYCRSINGGKPPVTFTFSPDYLARVLQNGSWVDAEPNAVFGSMKESEVKVYHNGAWRDTE